MADPFIEERLTLEVRYGASYGDEYATEITTTKGGKEYRRLLHPYPVRYFNIAFVMDEQGIDSKVLDLYDRCFGSYAGFRVRAADDYSTNGKTASPTAIDQQLALVSVGIYQLQKVYGSLSPILSIGRPIRTIYKPVANTTRIAIGAVEITNVGGTRWSVDTTTGLVTFAANKTRSVTNITQASQAVVTIGSHAFANGDVVHFSGVAGMTEINNLRGTVVNTGVNDITVDINSSGFAAYASGGTINTNPQSGESVTGGCEFDIPCRFNTRVHIEHTAPGIRSAQGIEIKELITL